MKKTLPATYFSGSFRWRFSRSFRRSFGGSLLRKCDENVSCGALGFEEQKDQTRTTCHLLSWALSWEFW
jgi:hypothetical protein